MSKKRNPESDFFLKHKKIILLSPVLWILIFLISAGVLFLLLLSTDDGNVPKFYSFNDREATYTIRKIEDRYYLEYKTIPGKNLSFDCVLVKDKKNCRQADNNFFTSIIAKSEKELEPFLNKKVRVKGKFISTNTQCIANYCANIGGGWVGIEIEEIEEAN